MLLDSNAPHYPPKHTHSCTMDDLVKVDKTLSPRSPVTIFLPTAGESLHVLRQVREGEGEGEEEK